MTERMYLISCCEQVIRNMYDQYCSMEGLKVRLTRLDVFIDDFENLIYFSSKFHPKEWDESIDTYVALVAECRKCIKDQYKQIKKERWKLWKHKIKLLLSRGVSPEHPADSRATN